MVLSGTDLTTQVATFSTTGETVTVNGINQVSGSTANDFSRPVIYTVTAEDGSTSTYTATVSSASSAKTISLFRFLISINQGLSSNSFEVISGTNISIEVPYQTDVTELIAKVSITGDIVTVNGNIQTSNVTANDFTNPVIYRVTAEDESYQDYTFTMYFLPASSEIAITGFRFLRMYNPP